MRLACCWPPASPRPPDATCRPTSTAPATARLAEAGVSLPAQRVDVWATVGGDGRLNGLRVVRSSGSLEADRKASEVLRRLKVSNPPVSLVGADVTVAVGDERLVAAGAP